jgi:methylenetetrahydrofolate reductase (NADPH)
MKIFRDELRKRNFVVTAECFLKPETDAESIRLQADVLRDNVDGVVLTDHQYGQTHLNTIAAARLLLDSGLDPIVQMSCRNRNRLALIADLLGAAALGVSSVLLIRGSRMPSALSPRPKAVMDMTVADLIATASMLKTDERLGAAADLFIGSTMTAHSPKPGWVPEKLTRKIDAGAQFIVTHGNMDVDALRAHMSHLIGAGLTRRASIIASTFILTSADDARWLRDNRANNEIPDSIVQRLEKANDPREEGLAICAEHLSQLARTPGISGANIIASTDLSMVPDVVSAADLDGADSE